MPNIQSLTYFIPELILMAAVVVMVLVDVFFTGRDRSRAIWLVSLVTLAVAGIALAMTPEPGDAIFYGALAVDPYSRFFKGLFLLATVIIIIISPYTRQLDNTPRNEYYLFLMVVMFGLFLMASALDLIIVYLSIEIVSIGSFILAGFLKNDRLSSESSLKYVIYGALSSGIMLYGLSLLFGLAGSTNIFDVQAALSTLPEKAHLTLIVALLLILAGFGYKISMAPFHFWTPDVYQGAPTTITAFLSVAPKAAGFALALRFLGIAFGASPDLNLGVWQPVDGLAFGTLIAVFSGLTMTVGNLIAIQQSSVKRMLAYSSIAHAGTMLMAATILNAQAFSAIMFYLVVYLFMNLGAFLVAIFVHNHYGYDEIDDWTGLGYRAPLVAIPMGIFLFSLTGLPPTAGFIGKVYIFSVLVEADKFWWLAILGVLNSVVSLYYYMRVIKVMFLDGEPTEETVSGQPVLTGTILALVVPVLLLGVYWTPLINVVRSSLAFFSPGM
ncbi:MAG: NADH-quinone oxidoreductase subunit N [Candidatus Marinimicrobia bacterium]|nr:NADH-quinone oxidoreductase subunit N [Candidatus Neomarinimicrobiota bacterium]